MDIRVCFFVFRRSVKVVSGTIRGHLCVSGGHGVGYGVRHPSWTLVCVGWTPGLVKGLCSCMRVVSGRGCSSFLKKFV
jgi:hypothetical protein